MSNEAINNFTIYKGLAYPFKLCLDSIVKYSPCGTQRGLNLHIIDASSITTPKQEDTFGAPS